MKKLILLALIGILIPYTILAQFSFGGGPINTPSFWKLTGTVLSPADDNNSLSVGDMVVTGNVTGALDMNGEVITNIGNAGTDFDSSGGLTLAENLSLKDDNKLFFDTAESKFIQHNTDHGELVWGGDYLNAISELQICANCAADGSGTWDPHISMYTTGITSFVNTTQGSVGNKYFKIDMTDGVHLDTGDKDAIIKADNIATSNKTFQFPNISGTLVTTAGAVADVNLGDGYKLITDEVRAYDAAGLKLYDDGGNGIFVEDGGNVGIGTTGPGSPLEISNSIGTITEATPAMGNAHLTVFNPVSAGGASPAFSAINFAMRDANNALTNYASIQSYIEINSHLVESGSLRFLVKNAGSDVLAMELQNDGNVGIGTASPTTKLQLPDDEYISVGDSADAKFVWETVDANAHHLRIILPEGGATNVPVVSIGDSSWDNLDLGIFNGETEPQLAIISAAADAAALYKNDRIFSYQSYTIEAVGSLLLASGDGASEDMIFCTDASHERMRILNDGNVGIGTASPTSILDIDKGTGYGQATLNGSSGGCLMLRDTDDAGWTECSALNGTLTCTLDADGICDGS